jgi:hypothetical protein
MKCAKWSGAYVTRERAQRNQATYLCHVITLAAAALCVRRLLQGEEDADALTHEVTTPRCKDVWGRISRTPRTITEHGDVTLFKDAVNIESIRRR